MSDTKNTTKALWKKGADFLGVPYAVLGGAMTWVSTPPLVAAISQAGGFGVLASGAMSPDMLRTTIQDTKKNHVPFGVNLIVMHPQLADMIQVCIQENVSHVILAGGLPPAHAIQSLKQAGISTIAFPPTAALAQRFVRAGIDALVIEGHEAGGHIGPVSTSVLAQEVLSLHLPVPVFVAGGIASGAIIASYVRMGAAGCQMGTPFVCATESPAHDNFKRAFIRAASRDAVVSVQLDPRFPVIPVRGLKNKGMQAFIEKQREVIQRFDQKKISLEEGQLEIEHFWAGALRRAVQDGDIENGSLMAGQSVGLVKSIQPAKAIIQRFLDEIDASEQAPPGIQ